MERLDIGDHVNDVALGSGCKWAYYQLVKHIEVHKINNNLPASV